MTPAERWPFPLQTVECPSPCQTREVPQWRCPLTTEWSGWMRWQEEPLKRVVMQGCRDVNHPHLQGQEQRFHPRRRQARFLRRSLLQEQ